MNMRLRSSLRPAKPPFIHPVVSDAMAPTYRAGQHSVICLPVEAYVCEGIYLVDGELYRCERAGNYVEVWRDNRLGPSIGSTLTSLTIARWHLWWPTSPSGTLSGRTL